MKIKDAWLPEHWKGKPVSAKELKYFGITLTLGNCRIEWRDRCGDQHWNVTYSVPGAEYGDFTNLEEFRRLDDAIKFALDEKQVADAVAFETRKD